MTVLLMLFIHLTAMAANINYNDCSWNKSTNQVDITIRSREMTAVPTDNDDWIGLGN
jgi:hypothetical protein